MATAKTKTAATAALTVTPPAFGTLEVNIEGTALLVHNRFPSKAREMLISKHEEGGSAAKNRKNQTARDFAAEADDGAHKFADGSYGIPCAAFRNALVRAAAFAGLKMTAMKGAVFIETDGFSEDGTSLVKLTPNGEPEMRIDMVKQQTTTTPRARTAFKPGWRSTVRITFDQDQLKAQDVINLLARAGVQVGILEGRPFSSMSTGQGWGTFRIMESAA